MREGYGSHSVCVCLCVCYHTNYCIPCLHVYVEIKVVLSFLCHFLHMHCVDFIENALFRSYGDNCWPLPSLLFDRLSIDKTDSDGFFSRSLVCRSSNRSYNSTGWSLVIVNCQLSFLTWATCTCNYSYYTVLYMWHARALSYSYIITCNAIQVLHSCGRSRYALASTTLGHSSTSSCCLRVLLPTRFAPASAARQEFFAQECFFLVVILYTANIWYMFDMNKNIVTWKFLTQKFVNEINYSNYIL